MMKKMKSIIMLSSCIVLFAATANAGLVYAYTAQAGARTFSVNADLTGDATLNTGLGGMVDVAVTADAIYYASGSKVWRTDLDGGNVTSTSVNGAETVAFYNGKVYAYTDQADRVFTMNADLSGESTIGGSYGGMVDMAVSADGIYFASGSKVWRTDLDGNNITSTGVNGAETVSVIPEPATIGLFAIASAGLIMFRRIRM